MEILHTIIEIAGKAAMFLMGLAALTAFGWLLFGIAHIVWHPFRRYFGIQTLDNLIRQVYKLVR